MTKAEAAEALRNVRKTTQPTTDVVTGLGRSGAMRHESHEEHLRMLIRQLRKSHGEQQ